MLGTNCVKTTLLEEKKLIESNFLPTIEASRGKDVAAAAIGRSYDARGKFDLKLSIPFIRRLSNDAKTNLAPSTEYSFTVKKLETDLTADIDWNSNQSEVEQKPKKKRGRIRTLVLRLSCAIAAVLGLYTILFDPKEAILDFSMKIAPGSRMLEIWMEPPITIFANVYIFNVTNPKEALAGTEKLRLQEIGPFVYKTLKIMTAPSLYILGCILHVTREEVWETFSQNGDSHSYSAKQRSNLVRPAARTFKCERLDPSLQGLIYFKTLPPELKAARNAVEFPKSLKTYLIGKAFYTVKREELRNTNVKFNDNDTMTYTPKRTVSFLRENSISDPKDIRVMVPNIALLGLGSMLSTGSSIASIGLMTPLHFLDSQTFLNLTVEDYLWGYNDPLVNFAHYLDIIPFPKIGLLDRMYDEGENTITIRLKDNGLNITDPGYMPQYSIETWNGSPGNEAWGYQAYEFKNREEPVRPKPAERCKLIRGATEGIIFPRNLQRNMSSYVYRKTFCRIMRIQFMHEGSFAPGINADWYGLPDEAFETPEVNPEHTCYCNPQYEKCLPKGLADITPCYYRIPAAVSKPHFLGGDRSLLEGIDGLNPSEEKHGSYAVLQPELGSVLDFTSRIQTNLLLKNIQYNSELLPLANLSIPLFWVELKNDGLNLESMMGLYLLIVIVPASILLTKIFGVISAAYLLLSLCCCLYRRRSSQSYRTPTSVSNSKETSAESESSGVS